jgi:hypothetical protein
MWGRGEAGQQQELSLPVVSDFTNHIRLKYDTHTLTELKGKRYFYLISLSCLNTGLFLSHPLQKA